MNKISVYQVYIFLVFFFFNYYTKSLASSKIHDDVKTKVEELVKQTEKLHEEGNSREEAKCYNQIAYIYWENNEGKDAIKYFKQSLNLNKQLGNQNAVKNIQNNLGFIYSELGDFHAALDNFNETLKINRAQNRKPDIAADLQNIAQVYFDLKQYNQAISQLEEAVDLAMEINDLKLTQSCFMQLAENYEKLGNSQKSKEYYEKSSALQSHLQKREFEIVKLQKQDAEIKAQMSEQQLRNTKDTLAEVIESYREIQLKNKLIAAESELKDLTIKEEKARAKEEQARAKANRLMFYYAITALVLLILILLLIYYQFGQKKKANKLLKEQNLEIEKQRDLANTQKQKITDSILYAQRIQNAILPPAILLDDLLQDYFVLFHPRDIVSGDFYWITHKENVIVLAAADCTGHGVPGAFMSMLGIAFLNEIVNKIVINPHIQTLQADEILNELRRYIINSLHQSGDRNEPNDGMDIALCIIDFDKKKMQFAGAHNPLYIIRNNELLQYSGDKMPVSYHTNIDVPFTKHKIDLMDGDVIYIFSDGFIDQFGGEKGFKFLTKNFKNLLIDIYKKPMHEQKTILLREFNLWKGDEEQLDDILIIGFKYMGEKQVKVKDKKHNWESKQILIAEDVDENYLLLAEALRPTNAKLTRVYNGKEAVEFCKKNNVDLILMDINMPVMNGYEATKIIKGLKKEIPIIMQTAMNISDEKNESYSAGADDYIFKPIDLNLFLNKIEIYFD